MPGHSVNKVGGVWTLQVGQEMVGIANCLPQLYESFFELASNNPAANPIKPRPWLAASIGGEEGHHHKIIVSHLAAILEELQRYAVPNARQAVAPNPPSYMPWQPWGSTDHDLIVQLLKDIWTELTNKPNSGGGFSQAPNFPAGPPQAGGTYGQPPYDNWVAQMVQGIHDELAKKPNVNASTAIPFPGRRHLFFVGLLVADMINMLS